MHPELSITTNLLRTRVKCFVFDVGFNAIFGLQIARAT